ncbi:hypothetical protein [Paraburkholderia sp. MM5384-R2]|uniref:hypothetical protein n=1 Tax=Paraburkholderia sp. MM5384-R2 TaxID=2723097 RepID=UPI00161996C8|nr:hypothetical protein [Paraburkholderia sp. MM5384-R2]MBB5502887.1 hypothetical protein [Paraburkholderia sp. MM5384-R2]
MTRFSGSASMAMKANMAALDYNGFFVRKTKMPLSCLTERHCGSMPLFLFGRDIGKKSPKNEMARAIVNICQ